MERLFIEATDESPEVLFDKDQNVFQIIGRSLPEEVLSFYGPLFKWLEKYAKEANELTYLKLRIDYFNSASQRALNELFRILEEDLKNQGKKVVVLWEFMEDDEEFLEVGKEFEEFSNLSFEYSGYTPQE